MKTKNSNARRVKNGNAAILAFEKASNHGGRVERPWALRDLLTDLMHWSVAKGFNFNQDLLAAVEHFSTEHPKEVDLVQVVLEVASDDASPIAKAHVALSNALEDPELGNDEVRDAAVDVCAALNALKERASAASGELEMVDLCTHVVNRKAIKNGTDWDQIRQLIAASCNIEVNQVPMNLVDRLYNHEDIFFDLRMEMHDNPCWLKVYDAFLEAGILVHVSEDNDAGEIVKQSADSMPMTQESLMEHRMAAHAVRADIITCIARAIEGTEEYVRQDLHHAVTSIMQSKDVLLTLAEVLPHCEWFECYVNLYKKDLLCRVR